MDQATKNKSVLFVSNTLTRGGAEVQVARLAIALKQRGWKTAVVSMTRPTALVEQLSDAGVPVLGLHMARGIPDPTALLRLRRIIRRLRPTIVHSHIVHANILSRMVRLICPMPVLISTAHNTNEGGRLRELAYRYTDHLADLTTNVSHASVERYIRIAAAPPNRIRFVPNGLDLQQYKPDPEARQRVRAELGVGQRFVWLAIGRFELAKDYPTMLKAMTHLAGDPADPLLLIAGQGKLRPQIEQLAETLNLTDRVRFLGVRSDVPAIMNAADAYVMSSAWEGMPLVLQEASAVGLPIVATRVGGNPEVVENGRTGLLVEPADPPALASAMRQMMRFEPQQRQQLGEAAQRLVQEKFELNRVVNLWEEIYSELLARRGMALASSTR